MSSLLAWLVPSTSPPTTPVPGNSPLPLNPPSLYRTTTYDNEPSEFLRIALGTCREVANRFGATGARWIRREHPCVINELNVSADIRSDWLACLLRFGRQWCAWLRAFCRRIAVQCPSSRPGAVALRRAIAKPLRSRRRVAVHYDRRGSGAKRPHCCVYVLGPCAILREQLFCVLSLFGREGREAHYACTNGWYSRSFDTVSRD